VYEKFEPDVAAADPALEITGAGGLIVRLKFAVPVPPAFVALSVRLKDPVVLGIPEITPFVGLTLNPAGNPPAPKLVGELEATMAYEKLEPDVPVEDVALEITGGGGLTMRMSVAVPVPPALVAPRPMFEAPGPVGVPEMTPVDELNVRPAGSPEAL
jgi:hypothetical protein